VQSGLEAETLYAKALLVRWGVDPNDILIETESKTTEQNMRRGNLLLQHHVISSLILVTSALHMPRSMSIFANSPFNVTPAIADQKIRAAKIPTWQFVVPSADALALSTKSIHEYYGSFFYLLKSRIK